MARSRKFILSAVTFFVVFGIGGAFITLVDRQRVDELRKVTTEIGVGQAYTLQRQLDRSLSVTFALASFLRQSKEIKMDKAD